MKPKTTLSAHTSEQTSVENDISSAGLRQKPRPALRMRDALDPVCDCVTQVTPRL
jgi:hypothetical protein